MHIGDWDKIFNQCSIQNICPTKNSLGFLERVIFFSNSTRHAKHTPQQINRYRCIFDTQIYNSIKYESFRRAASIHANLKYPKYYILYVYSSKLRIHNNARICLQNALYGDGGHLYVMRGSSLDDFERCAIVVVADKVVFVCVCARTRQLSHTEPALHTSYGIKLQICKL